MANNSNKFTDYRKIIGDNIKTMLHNKGITQSDFAGILSMPKSQLNRYILGKTMPNPEIFHDIATALETTVETLLSLHIEDAPEPETEIEGFNLASEIKAELRSCEGYCVTLKQSSNSPRVRSVADLLKQKIQFISANV